MTNAIFSSLQGAYRPVSWAAVAEEDPDYIVIHRYSSSMDVQEKVAWIRGRPELQECAAVRNNHFIPLTLAEVFPGIQNPAAIKKLRLAFDSEPRGMHP